MSLKDQLIIPVYLNEKTVLDMLAIIEDGFSMVSEVSSSNQNSSTTDIKLGGGLSTKAILVSDIFTEKPVLGTKKAMSNQKNSDNAAVKQIKSFLDELTHSGTVDFILEKPKGTLVLSTQEQYLANDNISEIIGGRFKILGKVIKICKTSDESINLLRKTSLYVLDKNSLSEFLQMLNAEEFKQFNLPNIKFEISDPSAIVIPVAIYA